MLSRGPIDRRRLSTPSLLRCCSGMHGPRYGMRGFLQPGPGRAVQMKKAQEYLGNYREQMVAANKGKSKTKAKSAENSPK